MAHNKRAGTGHFVINITVVVVNVDPKVVHFGVDLLYQHVGAIALVVVVEPVEGHVVRVSPARAIAWEGTK
jgi:hypothetical protein